MGVRLAGNQNAAIFDDFWQSRTPTYWTYFKREFDKKGVNIGVLAGFVLLLSGIANSIPNAKLVLLKGDHFIAAKKPQEFNRAVNEFLSE